MDARGAGIICGFALLFMYLICLADIWKDRPISQWHKIMASLILTIVLVILVMLLSPTIFPLNKQG